MATIQQINEKLTCLPKKDIVIATKFLDKRDFISLEELVNSDVEKVAAKYYACIIDPNEEPTQECIAIEEHYNALKDLQDAVSEQASAFKEKDLIEEDDFIEDETLDYYA